MTDFASWTEAEIKVKLQALPGSSCVPAGSTHVGSIVITGLSGSAWGGL